MSKLALLIACVEGVTSINPACATLKPEADCKADTHYGCAGQSAVWTAFGCKVVFKCNITDIGYRHCRSSRLRPFRRCSCASAEMVDQDNPKFCSALPPPSAQLKRTTDDNSLQSKEDTSVPHIGLLHTQGLSSEIKKAVINMSAQLRCVSRSSPTRLHLVYSGMRLPTNESNQLERAGIGLVHFSLQNLPLRIHCLYELLTVCMSEGQPQMSTRAFMLKPLMAWILPPYISRVIILDMDVALLRPPKELWAKFKVFDDALVGLAKEQSTLYTQSTNLAQGYNGGVQLLELARMRGPEEARYLAALAAACGTHRAMRRQNAKRQNATAKAATDVVRFSLLGDQTLYSYMAYKEQSLFFNIGCEWNRQLGSWSSQIGGVKKLWVNRPDIHACPDGGCAAFHANLASLKCAAALLRANPTCENWDNFIRRVGRPRRIERVSPYNSGSDCGAARIGFDRSWTEKALRTHYADCCIPVSKLKT
uniref:Nucleotide-diphospho-sugar transferase domain-containing protein n=1 Tax=Chrysotila carterae TaxID=13221 RepID=A0A7S4C187_CHRCT